MSEYYPRNLNFSVASQQYDSIRSQIFILFIFDRRLLRESNEKSPIILDTDTEGYPLA